MKARYLPEYLRRCMRDEMLSPMLFAAIVETGVQGYSTLFLASKNLD